MVIFIGTKKLLQNVTWTHITTFPYGSEQVENGFDISQYGTYNIKVNFYVGGQRMYKLLRPAIPWDREL